MTPNLDRLPHELVRAIDIGGETLVDLLDPGTLAVAPPEDGTTVTVLADGRPVGRLPLHRLGPIDPALIPHHLEQVANVTMRHAPNLTAHEANACAEQMIQAVRAGRYTVLEPLRSDHVYVFVVVDETCAFPPLAVRLFRPALVPDWPADDWPAPPDGTSWWPGMAPPAGWGEGA